MEQQKEIAERINAVMQLKEGGDKRAFMERLNWSPAYLHKMLNGHNIGLNPLLAILQAYTDINARWLLMGTGAMTDKGAGLIKSTIYALMELEKYLPVMSADEIQQLSAGKIDWGTDTIQRWDAALVRYKKQQQAHYDALMAKQDVLKAAMR